MIDPLKHDTPIVLARGRAAEQIINDLRDQILQGRYARGSRLPSERELAQHYQVSVPTVREAIRGLAAVHLVEARHGTGVYVTAAADLMFAMAASAVIELENVQLLDVLDVFEPLLRKAATLACSLATDAELHGVADELNSLDAAGDTEAMGTSLKKFISRLVDASHNVLIATIGRFLADVLIEIVQDQAVGLGDKWQPVFAELGEDRRRLAQALVKRRVRDAERLTQEYLRHTKNLVSATLDANAHEGQAVMRRAAQKVRAR